MALAQGWALLVDADALGPDLFICGLHIIDKGQRARHLIHIGPLVRQVLAVLGTQCSHGGRVRHRWQADAGGGVNVPSPADTVAKKRHHDPVWGLETAKKRHQPPQILFS